jgi:hypothetical protein
MNQEVRLSSIAAVTPPPTNKTPAATANRSTPPVSGSVPASADGLEEASGVAVAAGVAVAVGVALAVDVALEVRLADTSSPVGLSS